MKRGEQAVCVTCGHAQMTAIRPYRTNTKYGRRVFGASSLYECGRCGLVQVFPQPDTDSLNHYYAEDYRKSRQYGADVADANTFPRDNLFYFNRGQSITDLLEPHIPQTSPEILDVGAGFGHILYALGQRYPSARRRAIEYSKVSVDLLTKTGVDVVSRPMEEVLAEKSSRYDLVILSHVLEHLQDPRKGCGLIRESLRPGGVFYAEVPNIPVESLRKYPDHHWAPRYDEPHITFFSKKALEDLIVPLGFEKVFCETAGPEYKYISGLRFHLPPFRSTVTRMMPKPLFDLLRRQVVTSSVRVHEREESFYQYCGFRIWIRSIWRRL